MTQKIKIIFAENRELFRKSLITLLKTVPEFNVIAEACNGKDLLEKLKRFETDIVLLDTEMPVMDGKTALEIIKNRFPKVKVIILNFHSDVNFAPDFMAKGAGCYLNKDCEVETLFKAIKAVYHDGYYFDLTVSKAMLGAIVKDRSISALLDEVVFNDRETEILKAICDGKTNKEIASDLHLSASAIDFHRTKIYSKTKCSNVTSLLKFALKKGIVALS